MPNPALPRIPISLDRPRHILFDFNALASYEEATGDRVMIGFTPTSIRQMRALLWAGLLHDDPGLTVEDVGAMVHMGNMTEVSQAVAAALSLALPLPSANGAMTTALATVAAAEVTQEPEGNE